MYAGNRRVAAKGAGGDLGERWVRGTRILRVPHLRRASPWVRLWCSRPHAARDGWPSSSPAALDPARLFLRTANGKCHAAQRAAVKLFRMLACSPSAAIHGMPRASSSHTASAHAARSLAPPSHSASTPPGVPGSRGESSIVCSFVISSLTSSTLRLERSLESVPASRWCSLPFSTRSRRL